MSEGQPSLQHWDDMVMAEIAAGEWAEQALIFLPILVEKLDTFELHKPLRFWKFGRKEIFKRSVIYSLLISHEVFNQ